ncbi:MAG: CHASE2 domain-containing protein, partial [Verrucomicrobiota bacterium]
MYPRHPRLLLALILSGIWSLLLLATQATHLLEKGDIAFSLWAQSKPPQKTMETPSLALIAIDRIPSDRPWPWPRLDFAIALRALVPCFPQSVTFEALLHDRDQRQEAFDTTFAHLVERFDHVVFASAAFQAGSEMPPPQNLIAIPFVGSLDSLTPYHSLYWPVETFASNSHVGISNLPFNPHQKPTTIPLIFRWRNQIIPSLALQAATIQLHADLTQSLVKPGLYIELRDAQKKLLRVIPIDSQGSMRLRHRPLNVLTIPFDDFLVYTDQRERGENPAFDLRQLRQKQV